MLGAVRGPALVGLQTVLYAWATLACSLLLIPVAHMGPIYAVVALGRGRLVRPRDAPALRPGARR